MQLPHHLVKSTRLAQDSGRQQMRLRQKRRRLQAPVLALPHHPLDVLLGDLEASRRASPAGFLIR
jgi:hypothetical protein